MVKYDDNETTVMKDKKRWSKLNVQLQESILKGAIFYRYAQPRAAPRPAP